MKKRYSSFFRIIAVLIVISALFSSCHNLQTADLPSSLEPDLSSISESDPDDAASPPESVDSDTPASSSSKSSKSSSAKSSSSSKAPSNDKSSSSKASQSNVSSSTEPHTTTKEPEIIKIDDVPELSIDTSPGEPLASIAPTTSYTAVAADSYYCYTSINSTQKTIYKDMCKMISCLSDGGYLSINRCSENDILIAFTAVLNDNPQFFWMSRGLAYITGSRPAVCFRYSGEEGEIDYLYSYQEAAQKSAEIKNEIAKVFSAMPAGLSEFDRELYLHDWICEKNTYCTAAVNNPSAYMYAFCVEGVILKGSAVCEGYARTLQLLLYYAGVQNTLVCGDVGIKSEAHMWNMVKIDGVWGHTDATWNDDAVAAGSERLSHLYMGLPTDEIISSGRKLYSDFSNAAALSNKKFNIALPEATLMDSSYLAKTGMIFTSLDQITALNAQVVDRTLKGESYAQVCVLKTYSTFWQTINAGGINNIALINKELSGKRVSSLTDYQDKTLSGDKYNYYWVVWKIS